MNIFQLENYIRNGNPNEQYAAARELGKFSNDPMAVKLLYSACYEADDPKLQQECVRSLRKLVGRNAMETFRKSTYSKDPNRRMRAYYHLGTLGYSQAIDEVLKGLADGDYRVRRAAVVSIGRLGTSSQLVNMLRKLLNGYEEQPVADAAKRAISTWPANWPWFWAKTTGEGLPGASFQWYTREPSAGS